MSFKPRSDHGSSRSSREGGKGGPGGGRKRTHSGGKSREFTPRPTEAPTVFLKTKSPEKFHEETDELLKSVSRSFYLSIKTLPKSLRPTISLAYLLARASDTIADCAAGTNIDRIQLLHSFVRLVKLGPDQEWQERVMKGVAGKIADPDEKKLLEKLPTLLAQLDSLAEPERDQIVRVLLRILFAQESDLKNFPGKAEPKALESAEKLDQYTYFIAGCVGEFWTNACRLKEPDFSDAPDSKLLPLAVRYGKGLQLVNILRDLPADLKHGRCYLPEDELIEAGLTAETIRQNPEKAAKIVEHWTKEALDHLAAGWLYVQSIKNLRIRYASAIPILVGLKTISLMKKHPPLLSSEKIKIPRSEVKMILLKAGVGSVIGPFLQQMYRGMHRQAA